MTKEKQSHFEILNEINVNDKTCKKKDLTYLPWSVAWGEVKKRFINADYEVVKYENNLPYLHDEKTGYLVNTKMTIDKITHEMWLPVMDGANKAMKSEPYEYSTKYGKKKVEAATMFDINKTIMRCLVKNIAMFGLGLYIYNGEEFPEEKTISQEEANQLEEAIESVGGDINKTLAYYKAESLTSLKTSQFTDILNKAKAKKEGKMGNVKKIQIPNE